MNSWCVLILLIFYCLQRSNNYKITLLCNWETFFVLMMPPRSCCPGNRAVYLSSKTTFVADFMGILELYVLFSITSCLVEHKAEAEVDTASFWHARGERWGRAKKEDKLLRLCGVREAFFLPQTFYELSLAREKETGTRSKTAWSLTRPSGKHFSHLTTSLWSLKTQVDPYYSCRLRRTQTHVLKLK